ncbi:amidohydrolase [Adhaeribacter sp. BT258]|uniref:Amidohydrolase n=1 Tax=Adhaeribacter terrigena TaxID=2793070 RepID=A0ABS1C256_9BACT|nr:amidohydrolase [Adhaeribacter terrigena]MBK0403403.1 amidohydrolase [Adhaeribacter terrigena]
MPLADLTVTLIQTELCWENPAENRRILSQKIAEIASPTDLIVLPEMFTTGFSMQTEKLAEKMTGPTVKWLLEMAKLKNAAICGSIIIEEENRYYNRLLWAQPDGQLFTYDKRHLFRMAHENGSFSAGKSKLIVHWRGWNICPLVCYDLRFPVFSRWTKQASYDLLLYVANWPEKRAAAWKTLLPARAIENLSYCLGVNRVGKDENGILYSGDSVICDPQGATFFLPSHTEAVHTQILSAAALESFRQRFPAFEDADAFELL